MKQLSAANVLKKWRAINMRIISLAIVPLVLITCFGCSEEQDSQEGSTRWNRAGQKDQQKCVEQFKTLRMKILNDVTYCKKPNGDWVKLKVEEEAHEHGY